MKVGNNSQVWLLGLILLAGICAVRPSIVYGNVPEMERAQTIYRNQLHTINDETSRQLSDATRLYIRDLERLETVFRQEGELRGMLAIRAEKNRLAPDPDSNIVMVDPLPAEAATLLAAHEERGNGIRRNSAERVKTLSDRYIKHLTGLQRELTRQDRIDDALVVAGKINDVRQSKAYESAVDLIAEKDDVPEDGAAEPAAADGLEKRLENIAVASVRITSSSHPVRAVNALIDHVHTAGITIRIDGNAIPNTRSYTYSDGRRRYSYSYFGYSQPASTHRMNFDLTDSNALALLQSICEVYGLGYFTDTDAVIIVTANDDRATWSRPAFTAGVIAARFHEDSSEAVTYFSDRTVRISGVLLGVTRNLWGHEVAILAAPRLVHIELTGNEADTIARMNADLDRLQEAASRQGWRPIRRMGEPVSTTPLPDGSPVIRMSVSATYRSHREHHIIYSDGHNMRWARSSSR